MPDAVRASYLRVLVALAEFYVLVRPQLQSLAFPTHKQSRFTRKILGDLVRAGFVGKTRRTITYDATRAGCPVYFLAPEGREKLCEWTGDEFYLAASVARPRDDRLEHWIAIAEWRLRLSAALAHQDRVSMPLWVNEWNKLRTDGVGDYYLHTQFGGDKKLSCSPDLGFTLAMQGVSVPNYGEADLGSSSVEQVIARKHQGYHLMQANDQWRERHFPGVTADTFRVLVLTTSRWRRDRMAKLIADKPSADRWRFACWDDFRAESLLHELIWIDAGGNFRPLATPPAGYQPLAESYAIVKRSAVAVVATNESENLEEARS
jgi:hypothetical protein